MADINALRQFGYAVSPPSDPADCTAWEMTPPSKGNEVYLVKDEAEGWEKADQHWYDEAAKGLLLPITAAMADKPAPVEQAVEQLVSAVVGTMMEGGKPSQSEWVADARRAVAESITLASQPLAARVAELEAENARLRDRMTHMMPIAGGNPMSPPKTDWPKVLGLNVKFTEQKP